MDKADKTEREWIRKYLSRTQDIEITNCTVQVEQQWGGQKIWSSGCDFATISLGGHDEKSGSHTHSMHVIFLPSFLPSCLFLSNFFSPIFFLSSLLPILSFFLLFLYSFLHFSFSPFFFFSFFLSFFFLSFFLSFFFLSFFRTFLSFFLLNFLSFYLYFPLPS